MAYSVVGFSNIVSVTSAYTANHGDIVLADATTAAFSVTLPAPRPGFKISVKKIDGGANAVTVVGTIDGATNYVLGAKDTAIELVANSTGYYIVGANDTGLVEGVEALGAISATVTLPAVTYNIATATLTPTVASTITLPHAVAGETFEFQITNGNGTFVQPNIVAASGEVLDWLTAPVWITTNGGVNIIDFVATATGTWQAAPITSGLGPASPIQSQIFNTTNTSFLVPDPVNTPFYQITNLTLSGNTTIQMPPVSPGKTIWMQINQPVGGAYTVTWPGVQFIWATSGNAAPSGPAAGTSQLIKLQAFDNTRWIAFVEAEGYGAVGLRGLQFSNNSNGWTNSLVLSFASAVGAGDLLVVAVSGSNTSSVSSITDSVNGAWTKAVGIPSTAASGAYGPVGLETWYFANSAAGFPSVTVNMNAFATVHATIGDYAGVLTTAPLDVVASSSGTSAIASTGTTAILAGSGELVVAAIATDNGDTYAVPSGWTLRDSMLMDTVASSTAAQGATVDLSASDNWVGNIAVFKV